LTGKDALSIRAYANESQAVHQKGHDMKAFWTSVAAAIMIGIMAGVVLTYGVGFESRDVHQSAHGAVRL
jgi:hypothetical protein